MAQGVGSIDGLGEFLEADSYEGGFLSAEAGDALSDFEAFDQEDIGVTEGNFFDVESFEEFSADGHDFEEEYAMEADGDQFLGAVWKAAKKAAKVVAPIAKKFAPQIGTMIGGALGGPAGAAIGGKLGSVVRSLEADNEIETEEEMNAMIRVPAIDDQLSEAMAVAASKAPVSDALALGSAITITISSRAPLAVKTVTPVLAKASADVARRLAATNDPRARTLIRTLPTIQRRTIATLTRKAQTGKPVTPRTALRVMAKQANRTLTNPNTIAKALAGNAAKKRQIDRRAVARAERFY
ncbi:hypothetical protein IB238_17975 [Rhizobium sp. ARZ01]|uniref:hypothetical protein n=1 Tax=Rhizobium sp. ARZ01 TaxID=2769313 RepID=UPI0017874B6E|nr:hypothetical protein [Rhizobium sp. ARZ01]MBD9374514.1 hypothetical protein [Rhizobium sp. ARZ01]